MIVKVEPETLIYTFIFVLLFQIIKMLVKEYRICMPLTVEEVKMKIPTNFC